MQKVREEKESEVTFGGLAWMKERIVVSPTEIKQITSTRLGIRGPLRHACGHVQQRAEYLSQKERVKI